MALFGLASAGEMKLYAHTETTETTEPVESKAMTRFRNVNKLMKSSWEGFHQGMYGPVQPIDDDCFGDWIADDIVFIGEFFKNLKTDIWSVTYDDSTRLAYSLVDLMFLNDEYCNFRTTTWDVINFCKGDDKPCKGSILLQNLQTNAFGLITETT